MKLAPRSTIRLVLFALPLSLSLAGCETVHGDSYSKSSQWETPDWNAQLFYSQNELNEIEFDNGLREVVGERLNDVERKRAGVRVTAGTKTLRAYVQLFAEELDEGNGSALGSGATVAIDDLYGIGGGIEGASSVSELAPDVQLVLPFQAGFNFVIGDGKFTEQTGGSLLATGFEETELAYIEAELSGGVGVNYYGFRSSIGLYLSSFKGSTNEDIDAGGDAEEFAFKATNTGLFLDFRYQNEATPLHGGLRATAGDVTGIEAFFGFSF
ncbi:MAG: hypothetical protein ACI87A_002828 [Planctomycetota bacterium]|jgi:hypothetical protein